MIVDSRRSQSDNTPVPALRGTQRLVPFLALLLLAGIIFAEHYHTRHEPLERDMPAYAVVANEVLHGRPLYSGVFDQKPPAVYITYAAAEMMTGFNRQTLFLMAVLAALVTLPGVYLAGVALTGRVTYGLCAAGLWTLLDTDLHLQANQANTEVFMNACVVWALLLLFRSREDVIRWPAAVGIGLLLGWATLYKPVVVTEFVCLFGSYTLFPPGGAPNRIRALTRGLISLATVGVMWAVVVIFFAAEGHFRAFYDAMVVYNRFYAGSLRSNFHEALHLDNLLPAYLKFCLPLAAIPVAGFLLATRRGMPWQWLSLLGLTVGTYAAISLPGRFYPHYYQLWLPLLCIAPAYGLATLAESFPARHLWLLPVAGLAPLLIVLRHEIKFYRLPAVGWSAEKYGPEFIEADQVGQEIKSLLTPGESFYDGEVDPELYLETGQRPPSGIFYAEPITAGPFIARFTPRVQHDLSAAPPQLITSRAGGVRNPVVRSWVVAHYYSLAVSPAHPDFILWVLRGGTLDARLRAKHAAPPSAG